MKTDRIKARQSEIAAESARQRQAADAMRTWEERAFSIVRAGLDATYRERACVMGHGYAAWYVPGTLRVVIAREAPSSEFKLARELSPVWGNDTSAHQIVHALRSLPTLG